MLINKTFGGEGWRQSMTNGFQLDEGLMNQRYNHLLLQTLRQLLDNFCWGKTFQDEAIKCCRTHPCIPKTHPPCCDES